MIYDSNRMEFEMQKFEPLELALGFIRQLPTAKGR